MFKMISPCVLLCALVASAATPAYAQRPPVFGTTDEGMTHTINFTLGRFFPRSEDARDDLDVLIANQGPPQFLLFDFDDFRSATFGVEYLTTIGDFVEVGGGFSFASPSVDAIHRDLLDSDGTEIEQQLKLRVVPIALTARVLPLGRSSPIQPYIGGGLGIFPWRYRETGEFVEFIVPDCTLPGADCPIFEDEFETSGTAVGPVIVGGLKFAGDGFTAGGEIRYHRAVGEIDDDDLEDFFGSEVDLGGLTFQFTIGVRF